MLEYPITLALLAVNIAISGYTLMADPSLLRDLSFRPVRITQNGEYHRLFTSGFVHAGLAHLGFNMITLFFFGPLLEGTLGPGRFLLLYFGSEACAQTVTFAMHRNDVDYASVGASGAISGVLFAFCLFEPFAQLLIFLIIPMPAILFAVLYVVISIYALDQPASGPMGRIAHEAHLGGAIGGVIITILLAPVAIQIFLNKIQQGLQSFL